MATASLRHVDLAARLCGPADLTLACTCAGVHRSGSGDRVWGDAIAGLMPLRAAPAAGAR